jgi:hypothetical protein
MTCVVDQPFSVIIAAGFVALGVWLLSKKKGDK